VERFGQRQGFLISATVHLILMTLLTSREISAPRKTETAPAEAKPRVARVMLPPPEVLRQLLPPRLQPPPPPAPPAPAPPAPETKDRISIGPPSEERAKRLLLRPEDDLTAVAKGRPRALPTPAPPPSDAVTAEAKPLGTPGTSQEKRTEGLMLPPGLGPLPRGQEAPRKGTDGATREPSIASSLRNLDRRIHDTGDAGLPHGTVQRTGPLSFDPQGADFTVWVNHFKNEVYRNWIVPQPALLGFRGHVDIEFTVERNGSLSGLRLLKSAGTAALDRAAANALLGSRLMALPSDYGPTNLTIQVTFYYNEAPSQS
jgi:periplasmic protein TonB